MGWGLLLLPIAWIAHVAVRRQPGHGRPAAAVRRPRSSWLPGIAADLAAVLLILLGLYGLAAAFAVSTRAVGRGGTRVTICAKLGHRQASPQAPGEPAFPAWRRTIGVRPAPGSHASDRSP